LALNGVLVAGCGAHRLARRGRCEHRRHYRRPPPLLAARWLAAALALALLAVETWLLVEVVRQQGRILLLLDALETGAGVPAPVATAAGLPVGRPAPAFSLPGLYGETSSRSGQPAGARRGAG
jgi:hypothetical protein